MEKSEIEREIIERKIKEGVALFNAERFFDAHEVLEDAWRPLPLGHPLKLHLQGMIQLAVAFHHQSSGNLTGARSVLERASRNLAGADKSFRSLNMSELRADLEAWRLHLAMVPKRGLRRDSLSTNPSATLPATPLLPKINHHRS